MTPVPSRLRVATAATAAIAIAASISLLSASSAVGAGPAGDSITLTMPTAGSVASSANAAVLPGWKLPSGQSNEGEVTADGEFRISNGKKGPFFTHLGYWTPALTVPAAETAVDANAVNTFDVSLTVASVANAYQEGLSIGVALDDQARLGSRYGGNIFFVHQDDVLKIVSFWADPSKNAAPPVASADIVWTEKVHAELDPTVSHEIRVISRFVDGPDNDTVEIYADGLRIGTAGTFEGYVAIKGTPLTTVAAPVGSLHFFSGANTTSKLGLSVVDPVAIIPALLGKGFLFSDITYSTYDVEPDPVVAPTPAPAPAAVPDAVLDLPPTADTSTPITATGEGFDPYELVDFTVYSTPIYLGWVRADAFGTVSFTFTAPKSFSAGQTHTVQGVGQRSARVVNSSLSITGSALAATGLSTEGTVAIGAGGSLLVATGLALLASRRRVRA